MKLAIIREQAKAPEPDVGRAASLINTTERLWMTALLINNRDKALTIREFASLASLSLGFISKFSNLLREAGFLKPERRLQVVEPGQLLNIIRDLYFFEGNTMIPYYTKESTDLFLGKIKRADKQRRYALTRMAGASLIAPFVRYQLVDFYVEKKEEISYWKKQLSLIDVEMGGNVYIIIPQDPRILSQSGRVNGWAVVNNVQLYLDLYKYPARGREQAEFLRRQVLKI